MPRFKEIEIEIEREREREREWFKEGEGVRRRLKKVAKV
jgi:hypothetical protein